MQDRETVRSLLAELGVELNWKAAKRSLIASGPLIFLLVLLVGWAFGFNTTLVALVVGTWVAVLMLLFSAWCWLEAVVLWRADRNWVGMIPVVWLGFFSATSVPAIAFDLAGHQEAFHIWFEAAKWSLILAAIGFGLLVAFVFSPLLMLGWSAWLLIDGQIGPGLAALLIGVPVSGAIVAMVAARS